MNALTAVKQPDDALSRTLTGFSIAPSVQSPRLLELTFCAEVPQQFLREVEQWPVQALEYKSFLRFKIAKILDDMCGNQLHPLARRPLRWTAPLSKNVTEDVFHPVFDVDQQGRPVMRYIDPFAQPKDFAEGVWLSELSDALEGSKNILSIPVPVGKFLLINNLFWLHGRDRFTPHPDLRRELMRQRGYISYATQHDQTHQ